MQLIYSPDDKGWYWQRLSDYAVSQLFKSKDNAKKAKRFGHLEWSRKEAYGSLVPNSSCQ